MQEGRAGIRRDENGDPFVFIRMCLYSINSVSSLHIFLIIIIAENVDTAGQTTKTSKSQLIVSVSMPLWQVCS